MLNSAHRGDGTPPKENYFAHSMSTKRRSKALISENTTSAGPLIACSLWQHAGCTHMSATSIPKIEFVPLISRSPKNQSRLSFFRGATIPRSQQMKARSPVRAAAANFETTARYVVLLRCACRSKLRRSTEGKGKTPDTVAQGSATV